MKMVFFVLFFVVMVCVCFGVKVNKDDIVIRKVFFDIEIGG